MRDHLLHAFYQKFRLNYRKEYHTVRIVEHECCEGYVQIGTECVPHCPQSCKKGYCLEPNVCICHAGYRASNDTNDKETCVPVCTNGCINGTCVEPDICSCNEDYWMDSDGFTCRPVCDEECERNYGYCSEPHVCSCRAGYKKTGNDSTSSISCEPVCDRACTNSYCAAPNVCKCLDGYEVDQFDRFTCVPKCDEICVFGACIAPQMCFCNDGYTAVNASVCEPICSKPCKMGTCIAPETCSCNDGYEYRNGSSKYVCEPICEMDCNNGTCVAPGVCVCDESFVYDNQTNPICKPHCAMPCEPNERCTSPNTCTCSDGYRLTQRLNRTESWGSVSMVVKQRYIWNSSLCEPVCNFECIKGTCTAPNVCTCDEDYEPSWIKQHQLSTPLYNSTTRICVPRGEPACDPSCGNNEICTASLTCNCYDGYTRHPDDPSCVPLCAQECSNGTCTAPDRCTCDAGFALRNESFCEPICERGCENGDCLGPNYCVCRDNFVPNTGSSIETECIPVCSRNCTGHGACIIEDDEHRCKCHYGWTGWDCDQPTICIITMDFNSSDINRITIRNDTNNSIIMQAYENAPYCYQCDNSLNKESLCYVVHSDKGNTTPIVGCLFSTDLPCYLAPHYSASINVAKIVWPLVAIAILIATILIARAYLMYRRREKKKMITGIYVFQNI